MALPDKQKPILERRPTPDGEDNPNHRAFPTLQWKDLTPTNLNGEAAALGPEFNVIDVNGSPVSAEPAFETYKAANFLRIYDAFTQ